MKRFADITPMNASTLLDELEQATRNERHMRPGNSLRDYLAEVVYRRFTVREESAPTVPEDTIDAPVLERIQECVRRLDEERGFAAASNAPWSAQAQVTVAVMRRLLSGVSVQSRPCECGGGFKNFSGHHQECPLYAIETPPSAEELKLIRAYDESPENDNNMGKPK